MTTTTSVITELMQCRMWSMPKPTDHCGDQSGKQSGILVVSDSNIQLIPLAMFGMFPELKTAPDGSLHLIYSGSIGKSLHYAYSNDGLNWRIEPVGESFWWSGGWSLAVDAGSRPHISGYVYEDGIPTAVLSAGKGQLVYETIDTVDEVDGFCRNGARG
jgi:hypothetical protein